MAMKESRPPRRLWENTIESALGCWVLTLGVGRPSGAGSSNSEVPTAKSRLRPCGARLVGFLDLRHLGLDDDPADAVALGVDHLDGELAELGPVARRDFSSQS